MSQQPLMENPQVVTGDLERFRSAFRRLEKRLKEATRSSRYKPPTDLATARIHLESTSSSGGLLGEVLDLSLDGMKIAIEAGHPIEVGDSCNVAFGDVEGETYSLVGTVRWVEDTNYITVFGISLDSADCIDGGSTDQSC